MHFSHLMKILNNDNKKKKKINKNRRKEGTWQWVISVLLTLHKTPYMTQKKDTVGTYKKKILI